LNDPRRDENQHEESVCPNSLHDFSSLALRTIVVVFSGRYFFSRG
jgi:hypothetical protein